MLKKRERDIIVKSSDTFLELNVWQTQSKILTLHLDNEIYIITVTTCWKLMFTCINWFNFQINFSIAQNDFIT